MYMYYRNEFWAICERLSGADGRDGLATATWCNISTCRAAVSGASVDWWMMVDRRCGCPIRTRNRGTCSIWPRATRIRAACGRRVGVPRKTCPIRTRCWPCPSNSRPRRKRPPVIACARCTRSEGSPALQVISPAGPEPNRLVGRPGSRRSGGIKLSVSVW